LQPRLVDQRRPYKFLDAYGKDDIGLFFGRTREVEELHQILRKSRWVTLFGRSGVGKSSILGAGLMDRYRQHQIFILRSLTDPILALGRLQLARRSQGVIVVMDQFEEFFLRFPRLERREMLSQLCRLLTDPELEHVRWIFSLREDFLAEMGELEEHLPTFLDHRFRLANLTPAQARECITAPAERCGLVVEEALVDALLESLNTKGVDPPELQIVLDRLDAARKPGSVRLTLESYQRLGGVGTILVDYLYEVVDRHGGALARKVLLALMCDKGTKVALTLPEIGQRTGAHEQALEPVVAGLVQARILRQLTELGRLELSHEYLIAEIQSWADEAELTARHARMVLEHELESHHRLGSLIDRDRLDFLLSQSERLHPSSPQRDLLVRSSLLHGRDPEPWLPLEDYPALLLELLTDQKFPAADLDDFERGEVKRRLISTLSVHQLEGKALEVVLAATQEWGNPHLLESLRKLVTERLFQAFQQRVRRRFFAPAVMSEIPSGPFMMGSTEEQKASRKLLLPAYLHPKIESEPELCRVELDTFWLDRFPVTNAQYAEFQPSHEERYPEDEEHCPVVSVSSQQAQAYAAWLGKELVTEEEWEKAARGPDGLIYPWGNEFDPACANCGENGLRRTTPVGAYPGGQSVYGCFDMVGNVWEWTSSSFAPDGPFLVQKGGSTLTLAPHLTCSSRMDAFPDFVLQWVGFRLKTSILPDLGS
jgi:formylglycine-generating enzyme required for sulfatase activity